jgi:transposase
LGQCYLTPQGQFGIWLATEPMDMRAGTETALARVIAVFGAAKPHCAYLFANRRATRMKVLVHAGLSHAR